MHGPAARQRLLILSLLGTTFFLRPEVRGGPQDRSGPQAWVPTAEHVAKRIEGFELLVDPRLEANPRLRDRTMRELGNQLYLITRKVPAKALARLRKVRIFVESRSATACMAYHPSRRWLADHHHNPDMARCVELGNPETFLSWTKVQPWMVLHELAHAYHHRVLSGGFGNEVLRARFAAAKKGGEYESILHIDGRRVRAYALTNPQEYFAEASEAYFGTNDMYPFVRAELQRHDPELAGALRRLWGG